MSTRVAYAGEILRTRKVVLYEGTSPIVEGMPLCYNFDTTDNISGYSKSEGGEVDCQSTPNVTAEGYQNEGKFLRVEDPNSSNLLWFAGVVASGSWCGTTGNGHVWLDIYVPNGAIVPVLSSVNSTAGRTVLCVNSGSLTLGQPAASTQGRPVAIAEETVDRSGTAGLCLARLDPSEFLYQTLNGTSLIVGTGVTTEVTEVVNRAYYSFAGTDGSLCVQKTMGEITGNGGSAGYGVVQNILKVNSSSQGTPPSMYAGVACTNQLIFATGATGTGTFAALRVVTDNNDTTPATVSEASIFNIISDLNLDTNAPAVLAHMYFASDGTADPNYFFMAKDGAAVCLTAGTTASVTGALKIKIGSTDKYILLANSIS